MKKKRKLLFAAVCLNLLLVFGLLFYEIHR